MPCRHCAAPRRGAAPSPSDSAGYDACHLARSPSGAGRSGAVAGGCLCLAIRLRPVSVRNVHVAALSAFRGGCVLGWLPRYSAPGRSWPLRVWIALAGLAILASGLVGGFHAGVEYGWWEGITDCALTVAGGGNALDAVLSAPLTRCDQAPWTLLGVSLAGWNFIVSASAAIGIFALLARKTHS